MDQQAQDELFNKGFQELQAKLHSSGREREISGKFGKLKTDEERVAFVLALEDFNEVFPIAKIAKPGKSSSLAVNLRNEGNAFFKRCCDQDALRKYSESVAFSPTHTEGNQELALAYANRSAVLFHLKQYSQCLMDIRLSLEAGYPINLQYKLYDRQGKCHLLLGQTTEAEARFNLALGSLEKAKLDNKKIDTWVRDLGRNIKKCEKIQDGIEAVEDTNKARDEGTKQDVPGFAEESHQKYASLTLACKVAYTPEQGRYLVANRDIKPGEVILVEKPYASVLLPDRYSTHCHHCFSRCLAPVPCSNCPVARYCSPTCSEASWNSYHQYECQTLGILHKSGVGKFGHLAFRAIAVSNLQFLLEFREISSTSPGVNSPVSTEHEGCNKNGQYLPDDYNAIYHLVTHDSDRAVHDLFHRAVMAVFLYKCLERSHFFDHKDTAAEGLGIDTFVTGLLLSHLQLLPCNAHEISELEYNRDSVAESVPLEIGAGIYATLSLFNHSCDPTVNRNFYSDQCVVRAIKTIKEGAEVSDNYGAVYAVQTKAVRQEKLKWQYYFECGCHPCAKDWPLYPDIEHQHPVWQCDDCSKPLPREPLGEGSLQCPSCLTQQNLLKKKGTLEESQLLADRAFEDLLKGDVQSVLPVFLTHLEVMDSLVVLPWRNYNNCQEAIKQCYSILGNCYTAGQ